MPQSSWIETRTICLHSTGGRDFQTKKATAIAGDKSAEKVFVNGDPYKLNRKYGLTLLGHSSCHPDIGYYIDTLGPVMDKDKKWRRAEERAAKAKVAKELNEADLVRTEEMLSNGVSQRKVAEAMGISQSLISRYKIPESVPL